jgi:myo-inositol-hexaphosphate 3-phosphohydrolase
LYYPESQLKAAVASAQTTQSVKPQKRKRDVPNIKEKSAPPDKKKRAAAIISMGQRIYDLESELMDVDD